jgi:hypothetical protein
MISVIYTRPDEFSLCKTLDNTPIVTVQSLGDRKYSSFNERLALSRIMISSSAAGSMASAEAESSLQSPSICQEASKRMAFNCSGWL